MRRLNDKNVVLATHNPGKIREFRLLFDPYGISGAAAEDFDYDEPMETEDTFEGNAGLKASYYAERCGMPAIADDSGITVDALGGRPGVHTANWAESPAGRDYVKAMNRVWNMLEILAAPEPRLAQFRSTICIAWPGGHAEYFSGTVKGRLAWPMRGDLGFGFDPIFVPDGFSQTFGEMDPEFKNRISHRAEAMKAFASGCLHD